MRTWRAELHVHTVLSPCADVEMIPPLIVSRALERGINLIAITDHNASANVRAVQKAAESFDLAVIPGVELQTREEVHLICLFPDLSVLEDWQESIDNRLPALKNRPEYFGEQFVVDDTGDFIRSEDRLLLCSCDYTLEEAVVEVNTRGGLAIPAHVDRKAFGLAANLGFLPPGTAVAAVEYSRHQPLAGTDLLFPQFIGLPRIQSGDVHRLDEFLGLNELTLEAPTIPEIRLAFADEAGRHLRVRQFSN